MKLKKKQDINFKTIQLLFLLVTSPVVLEGSAKKYVPDLAVKQALKLYATLVDIIDSVPDENETLSKRTY